MAKIRTMWPSFSIPRWNWASRASPFLRDIAITTRRDRMCFWAAMPANSCSATSSAPAPPRHGRRRRAGKPAWWFNHSALFLDFLAGNQTYQCTPWSNPTYNLFGWQKPCYLLSDEGYAPTYKALIEDTEWEKYGVGKNPRCDNCMAH